MRRSCEGGLGWPVGFKGSGGEVMDRRGVYKSVW